MDIRRFFDTVRHGILKSLLRKHIKDNKVLQIIDVVIDSFRMKTSCLGDVGIPLGNVTSQLFANIYLHELDNFIKHELRQSYYLRYCDDFILLSNTEGHLRDLIGLIERFLLKTLGLELHPKKVTIKKLSQGIDFVGYVLFAHHLLVRTSTKQRMKNRIKGAYEDLLQGEISLVSMDRKLQSYLGILSHANQHMLAEALKNAYWVRE